jgi:hypothetical protein
LGTIQNDDPLLALSVNDVAVTEGNAGAKNLSFSVRLSAVSGRTVTADYATLAGSDRRRDIRRRWHVTFSPGQSAKSVIVTINGDTLAEPDETLLLRLNNPKRVVMLDGEATEQFKMTTLACQLATRC